MDDLTVLALRERFNHMGYNSGYDMLFKSISKKVSVSNILRQPDLGNVSVSRNPIKRFLIRTQKLSKMQSLYETKKQSLKAKYPFYNWTSFKAEYEFIHAAKSQSISIGHIAYAENNIGLLAEKSYKDYLDIPVVATVHQPMGWWKLYADTDQLQCMDRIVVLNEYEKREWEQLYPGKVTYLPHGINVDFFKPINFDQKEKTGFSILVVGRWLRDLTLISQILEQVVEIIPDIKVHMVYPKEKWGTSHFYSDLLKISKLKQVNWYHNISDNELLSLYQKSNVLLMALIDSSANNAILEAMSCGLPIICTDNPGLHSYVNNSFASLIKSHQIEAFVRELKELSLSRHLGEEKGVLARKQSEKFDWELIGDQVIDLYKQVIQ